MGNLATWAKQYWSVIALFLVMVSLAIMTGGDIGAMQANVNDAFGGIVGAMAGVLFWVVPLLEMPLVVVVLISGAIFFTLRFAFINIRGFLHAIEIVRGKYDDPNEPGEVSHFQALSSALSATVGLGNIAGVAVAVAVGGPGAVFWMMFAALFGMTSKFAECTLGQMYRQVDEETGEVRGGPMVYLREGIGEMGFPNAGKVLSVAFAILCIGGSFGGGNMFQANQSFQAMADIVPTLGGEKATGVVRVWSPEPTEIRMRRHLMKFERPESWTHNGEKIAAPTEENPAPEGAIHTPAVTFLPEAELNISLDAWKQQDGKYYTDIEAVAAKSGTGFNLAAGKVTTVAMAEVEGRKVNWSTPDGMTAENIDKLRGGAEHLGWLYGLLLAVLVGFVIIGGIQRIGRVADKIVPFMCLLYVISGIGVLIVNASAVPEAIMTILTHAFTGDAVEGGVIGVIIQGVRRAAFSNEAGVGSAAIAHSAARTSYPVREGLVALLEPFIDTIVICFMTGIVIVVTGVYADPATSHLEGVLLTSEAFGSALGQTASYALSVAVVLFAFSTMISWSYYGERCWSFLFGNEQSLPYRILFCIFVWLGCVSSLGNVLDFSDLMILSMAFPNILGVVMLSGKVSAALNDYWDRYKKGEFDEQAAKA